MIIAIPELGSHPTGVDQWYIYYNTDDDKIYVKTGTDPEVTTDFEEYVDSGASIRDSVRIGHTLARVKYAGRDYGTFQDEILAFIKDQYGDSFNDYVISQVAIMIVQYVSFGLDTLSWYLDKQVEENFITTAILRSSVNRFAKLLGYKPGPMVNASVDLEITLDKNYGFDIKIEKGEKLNGPNGLIYELDQDVTFTASEQVSASYPYTKTQFLPGQNISCYEGETYSETFTADGSANQIFKLTSIPDGKTIAKDSVITTVDGSEWTENDFLEFEQTDQYMVDYATDPPAILFGNGIIGNAPASGTEVTVTYVAGSGTDGSAAADTITSFKNPIVTNLQTIGVSVNNPLASSGASVEESLSSIKANAPKWFVTADRAVSKSDYITLAEKFSHGVYGSVQKANSIRLIGVENEVGVQDGLEAINQAVSNLSNFLTIIQTQNTDIRAATATISTKTTDTKTKTAASNTVVSTISTDIDNVKGHLADAKADIDEAEVISSSVPFQEIIGQGNGTDIYFTKTLTFPPITKSVSIVVEPSILPGKSSNTGDTDTEPGYLSVGEADFFVAPISVGSIVRIGGVKRQIREIVSATKIRYSGPRIYGSSLIVEVYADTVYGFDNGSGPITGPGISSAAVNYSTGYVEITFSAAPDGISDDYGVNIYVNYQYVNQPVIDALTSAEADIDEAEADADQVVTDSADITTNMGDIDTNMDDINTSVTGINTAADTSDTYVSYSLVIPDNAETATDNLEDYLDTIISGECKANIIRVSILTVDADGFYSAPSNGLISSLMTHLADRATATVTVSVVNGALNLVAANVDVKVKAKDAFSPATVLNEVSTQIDNVLKGRDFGQHLRLDEFHQAIKENVVTVSGETKYEYVNIKIESSYYYDSYNTGTPPSANSDGDLVIGEDEIVTKGSSTSVTLISET